jgi:hypothetical protein
MPELFNSYRDSPKVPVGWQPCDPPGAAIKDRIHNPNFN